MDRQEILDKVVLLVCENLEVEQDDVDEGTTFDSLGADSFDMLELVTALEDEFELTIDDVALENIATIGDAVDAIAAAAE